MTEQDAETTAEPDEQGDEDPEVDQSGAESGGVADGSDTEDGEDVASAPVDGLSVDVSTDGVAADEELTAAVADADDETVARTLDALAERVEALEDELADVRADLQDREAEVEDLTSRLKRKQADFQNYKKRVEERREEEKQRATEDLVTRLLDVRDNLQRALEQDEDADIRDGVEATFRELDRVFDDEGVVVVEPEPGEEVDPQRHEVLMRVDSDHPAGTVADVHRPGYEMGEKVIREAQVTVSEGEE